MPQAMMETNKWSRKDLTPYQKGIVKLRCHFKDNVDSSAACKRALPQMLAACEEKYGFVDRWRFLSVSPWQVEAEFLFVKVLEPYAVVTAVD